MVLETSRNFLQPVHLHSMCMSMWSIQDTCLRNATWKIPRVKFISFWFRISAARDPCVWARMPLYSEYIARHSLNEIVGRSRSLQSTQGPCGLDLSFEDAAKLPTALACATLLPVAVACEYLRNGCGLPAVFAFDLFKHAWRPVRTKAFGSSCTGRKIYGFHLQSQVVALSHW